MKKQLETNVLIHLWNSTKYSLQGLKAAFKTEVAFRLELYASIILIPLAFFIGQTIIEKLLLITSLLLILIIELINSAIETIVDRIGREYHELSGRAKDIGSAAVLVTLIYAFSVWAIILVNFLVS
jgi:diacylglycerol kinase (ATP)